MKFSAVTSLLFAWLLLAPVARADDEEKKVSQTAGNFEVETHKNITYNGDMDADAVRHKLDLYLPKGHKNYPVLIFIHGGAWTMGSKELYGPLGRVFAKNGIGTVVINYRLSPKVKHPAHIEDVAKAFAWTHKNISKYGGRADQIFVSGHSAGGHLAALLATDESYLKAEKLSTSDIKGAIPLSGVYTILPAKLTESAFTLDPELCRKASPLYYVKDKHPPFLIIWADKDYAGIPKMSEAFGRKLRDCKCAADNLEIAGRNHISIIIGVAKEEDPTTQAMLGFIAKHARLKLSSAEKK